MNLLHSKMFVSNELSKGFQIKSAVIKNVILKEKIPLFQQEKIEEKLSASLGCISLASICSFVILTNKIIYNVQTLPQLYSFQIDSFFFSLSEGFLNFTSTPPISLSPYSHSPIALLVSHYNPLTLPQHSHTTILYDLSLF